MSFYLNALIQMFVENFPIFFQLNKNTFAWFVKFFKLLHIISRPQMLLTLSTQE